MVANPVANQEVTVTRNQRFTGPIKMVAYTGSCHCGTVKYKFEMSPPIEERKVVTCNCMQITLLVP